MHLSRTSIILVCAYITQASTNNFRDRTAQNLWSQKFGEQTDQLFSGPLAFSHLPYARCLDQVEFDTGSEQLFDIALLGMPFDTGTSYRPGARFGPYAIRSGSRRQRATRGYTLAWGANPYTVGYEVMDCGDVCYSCMVIRCS